MQDFLLVYAVSGIAFVVNFAVYLGLYRGIGVDVMTSKVLGTCFGFVFNYSLRQFYVFSRISRFAALSQVVGKTVGGMPDRKAGP